MFPNSTCEKAKVQAGAHHVNTCEKAKVHTGAHHANINTDVLYRHSMCSSGGSVVAAALSRVPLKRVPTA